MILLYNEIKPNYGVYDEVGMRASLYEQRLKLKSLEQLYFLTNHTFKFKMKRKVKASTPKSNMFEGNFEGGNQKNRKMKPPKKTKYSKQFYEEIDDEDINLEDLDLLDEDVLLDDEDFDDDDLD